MAIKKVKALVRVCYRRLLVSLEEKLFQKSAITYSTVRSLSYLDPKEMATCKQVRVKNLKEKSYIAQSLICDFLGDVGGVKELRNLRIRCSENVLQMHVIGTVIT
ncbi:hypothetical protein PR048_012924 [Dryococelus australis]|uniref:Uncharacterized protein n=1 Tax=Dryococelus australis TaxID=614101 RepID=A0ABQ9HQP2_9NEOP|nr:hypothetical protein PR048_012924 [Dryococelus australis]